MILDVSNAAYIYLIITLLVGCITMLSPEELPFRVWCMVTASWFATVLINDNVEMPVRVLAFSTLDGAVMAYVGRMALQRNLAWLAVFSLIHFVMLIHHFFFYIFGYFGSGTYQLIYNLLYLLVLSTIALTRSGQLVSRFDSYIRNNSDDWSWNTVRDKIN